MNKDELNYEMRKLAREAAIAKAKAKKKAKTAKRVKIRKAATERYRINKARNAARGFIG